MSASNSRSVTACVACKLGSLLDGLLGGLDFCRAAGSGEAGSLRSEVEGSGLASIPSVVIEGLFTRFGVKVGDGHVGQTGFSSWHTRS